MSWQKERREVHKEEAFSSDHTDPLDQTIEEVCLFVCIVVYVLFTQEVVRSKHVDHQVIQRCRHGFQQEESESFTFSLPVSIETQSDDWDSAVQVRVGGAAE